MHISQIFSYDASKMGTGSRLVVAFPELMRRGRVATLDTQKRVVTSVLSDKAVPVISPYTGEISLADHDEVVDHAVQSNKLRLNFSQLMEITLASCERTRYKKQDQLIVDKVRRLASGFTTQTKEKAMVDNLTSEFDDDTDTAPVRRRKMKTTKADAPAKTAAKSRSASGTKSPRKATVGDDTAKSTKSTKTAAKTAKSTKSTKKTLPEGFGRPRNPAMADAQKVFDATLAKFSHLTQEQMHEKRGVLKKRVMKQLETKGIAEDIGARVNGVVNRMLRNVGLGMRS